MAMKIYTLDTGTPGSDVIQSHDGKEELCKNFGVPYFKTHSVEDVMIAIKKSRGPHQTGDVRQITTLEFRDLSHLTPAGRKLLNVKISYSTL